jgi:recombination protein RecA
MADLSSVVATISKQFKGNSDILFDPRRTFDRLPSGCTVVDLVIGGGFPRKRITEVFGMEHCGKSALTQACAGKAQAAGLMGILIDAETAFDPVFAQECWGLVQDNKTFSVFQPDNIEEADVILKSLEALPRLDYLIFDSVDALKPKSLIEGALADERRVGAHAQAMSRFVAKVKQFAKDKNCAVIFINQMRTNIQTGRAVDQNVGTGAGFNPMEQYTTTGGMSLRFYASIRLKLEYGGKIDDETGANAISGKVEKTRKGNQVKVINIKNKTFTPFLKEVASFLFKMPNQQSGWANDLDVVHLLKKRGRIRQQATKFVYVRQDGTEWSNIGSMNASENLFMSKSELMADARAQLLSLVNGSQSLPVAQPGVDFTPDEVAEPSAIDLQALTVPAIDTDDVQEEISS